MGGFITTEDGRVVHAWVMQTMALVFSGDAVARRAVLREQTLKVSRAVHRTKRFEFQHPRLWDELTRTPETEASAA